MIGIKQDGYLRKKKLAKNTVSSLVFRITTIICGFIVPRLILNSYGSEINGLINSIMQFLGIIAFLELGVGAVVQSSLYKPLSVNDNDGVSSIVVSGQKFFSKIAGILLVYVILLILFYNIIAKQSFGFIFTGTLILVISISSFAQYYFGIISSLLLIADQRGYVSYNIQTLTLVLNTLFCYILIRLGASIHIVKLITSIIYAIRPAFLAIYIKKNYKINWKIKYYEEPIKQKWNGVSQHIASVVLDSTDSIVLTIFDGLKAVSVYSIYNIIVSGIKQLMLATTSGIQSVVGELWAKQELDELRGFFGWIEWIIHTGTIFIFSITAIVILQFIKLYTYGVRDINYIQPIFAVLIIMANAGHCLRLPYNIMILAGGHYKQTQKCYITAAIINVTISIVTVKIFGLIGVAIGTLVAMLYQTIWMAIYDSKNLICWPIKYFIKQVAVDIIIIVCSFVFASYVKIKVNGWFEWVVYAIIITTIEVPIVIAINTMFYNKYIKYLMSKIIDLFKKR